MQDYNFFKNKKCYNLLFHGKDIVLIDSVMECTADYIIVNANLDESIPFLDIYNNKKVFPSYKSIEMMAQSLGCFQHINMSILNKSVPSIGFLLGARKFDIFVPYIELYQELYIVTKLLLQNQDGFGVYDSTIYYNNIDNNKIIATSTLNVLSPKDDFNSLIKNNTEEI